MAETNAENQIEPIEIFTEEQLNVLPQEAKDVIVYLSENLGSNQIMVLNPLIRELLELEELRKLEYKEGDKASEKAYEDAMRKIGAFNTKAADAKKAMKGPIDQMGKKIVSLEKDLKSIGEEVKTDIQKTFAKYIDAKAQKKAATAEKKDAEKNAVVEQLSEAQNQTAIVSKRSETSTKLKYGILEPLKNEILSAMDTHTLVALQALKARLLGYEDFDKVVVTNGVDLNEKIGEELIIGEDILPEIKAVYKREYDALLKQVNTKIDLLNAGTSSSPESAAAMFSGGGAPAQEQAPVEEQKTEGEKKSVTFNIDDPEALLKTVEQTLAFCQNRLRVCYDKVKKQYEGKPVPEDVLKRMKKVSGTHVLLGKVNAYILDAPKAEEGK